MNSSEWELSKENVQPLKHGRKVTSLTAALQPHNIDQHQQLILQRQSMEANLRSYTGDDPLAPWDEYIRWTEQAYPSGGKDSNMQVLLEKCLAQFKKDARYKNDARYVSCWIKLANNFLNDPLEIFQFMRDQAIGTGLSIFYEAWSWELEQHGNTKKADAVFREGLACHAQPKERLEAAHRDFQLRVGRATMSQIQDGVDGPESQTDQRDHLGDLRARGQRQRVGSQRVGAAKQSSKGGLSIAVPKQQVGQSFSVFCDNQPSGASQTSLPAPTGEWENMPVRKESQKENVQAAGPWAGQKVRQHRSAGIGISDVATLAQPAFKVHVDESAPDMTPRKMPEIGGQVLSVRKPDKPSNLLQNMVQQPVLDDKTKAMYCKHLIYNGANEMSFEELRAIKYNARRDAKRLEEERLALEKQRAEYQAMVKEQETMEQQLLQQRRLHQQQLEEQKLVQQQMLQQMQHMQQMQQQLQHMQQQQHIQQQQRQPAMSLAQVPDLQQRPAQVQQSAASQQSVPLQRPAQVQQSAASQQSVPLQRPATVQQSAASQQSVALQRPAQVQQSAASQQSVALQRPAQVQRSAASQQSAKLQQSAALQQSAQLQQSAALQQSPPLQQSAQVQHGVDLSGGQDTKTDLDLREPTVTRQLVYEETGTPATWMIEQKAPASHQQTPSMTGTHPINNSSNHLNMSQRTPGTSTATVAPTLSNSMVTAGPNVSQSRTPVEHGLPTPGSSHSRNTSGLSLSRMTPCHTPGGLTRPSPTMHTKEAMSVVMAMLNNPLGDDDDFFFGAGQQKAPAQRDDDFEAIFANSESHKSKPPSFPEFKSVSSDVGAFAPVSKGSTAIKKAPAGPGFTIFNESEAACYLGAVGGLDGNEELDHLDNQENMPPEDYVRPRPDSRPRLGILQPAQGIPFKSLEDQEREARAMERNPPEQMDAMEGVEPFASDDGIHPPDVMTMTDETILNHQDSHSAFKTASRMASTPYTSTGVLSFPPLSSIKPSLAGVDMEEEHRSLAQLTDASMDVSGGRPIPQPHRIMRGNSLENFEATECTIAADSQQQLSPIMERSNEDARSSASSSTNSTGLSHSGSTTQPGASSVSHIGLSSTHANPPTSLNGRSSSQFDLSTTVSGPPPSHPGKPISRSVVSASCESLSTTPQAPCLVSKVPSSTSSLGSFRDTYSAHRGLSTSHHSASSIGDILSSTRSQSGVNGSSATAPQSCLTTNRQIRPPLTSPSGLDVSNISFHRGLSSHRDRVASNDSLISRSRPMEAFERSFFDSNREAAPSSRGDHQEGFASELSVKNQPRAFRIFDDSTQCKPTGMGTTSGSFQVFEDQPSTSCHDIPGKENNFSREMTSQSQQPRMAFEEDRSRLEKPAHKVSEGSVFDKHSMLDLENRTGNHCSFQILDESATFLKPAAHDHIQSSGNGQSRTLASSTFLNHEGQQSEDSMMEINPSNEALHLSTSLMSKMHLSKEPEMDASLMDCSQQADGPNDDTQASNQGETTPDPFSVAVKARLLESLPRRLWDYKGYTECDYPMPELDIGEAVGLSDEWYIIEKLIGEGAFAKVYQASIQSLCTDDHSKLLRGENDKVALKVEKPACPWEFYISQTLHERLDSLCNPVDVRASLMQAKEIHVFPDGSCLVAQHHRNLTLLDAVNEYNKGKALMPEPLLLLFTIEILHIVEQMHACGIIHGDVKPDNFLLLPLDDDVDDDDDTDDEDTDDVGSIMTSTKHVKLIDFGRSIDMRLFPTGTSFTATCETAGFMCPEMLSGRPWTYQTDLFGIAATIHCLMFGTYMKVYEEKGRWKHTSSIKRSYLANWKQFFDILLNIPNCAALPSLVELRQDLEETFVQVRNNLDAKKNALVKMLTSK